MYFYHVPSAITAGKIGGSCTTATINTKGDCEDSNALCSATTGGTCFCATGYTGVDAAGCSMYWVVVFVLFFSISLLSLASLDCLPIWPLSLFFFFFFSTPK